MSTAPFHVPRLASIVLVVALVSTTIPVEPTDAQLPGTAPSSCESFSSPDHVVESWDGTPLAVDVHLPEEQTAPVVLLGHGYANQRPRLDSSPWLASLVDSGFVVVTWDARGHGQSGGQVRFDDPAYEGRDVLAIVDFVNTTQPYEDRIERDDFDNPLVGMSGVSYGGGVQFSALVADRLIGAAPWDDEPPGVLDALAPELAWNHLQQAAVPNGVPKAFIDLLLTGAGEVSTHVGGAPPPADGFCPNTGGQHPDQFLAVGDGIASNGRTERTEAWTSKRSPALYLDEIDEIPPVFLVQGLRDTTLPPNEAIRTFEAIRDDSQARLMLHATGHGWAGAPPQRSADLLAWFNHTLDGEPLPARLSDHDTVYARDGRLGSAMGTDIVYGDWDEIVATERRAVQLETHPDPLVTPPAPTSYADVTFFQGRLDGEAKPGRTRTLDAPGTAVSWDMDVGSSGLQLVGTPALELTVSTSTDELFLFGKLEEVGPDGRSEVLYHQAMAKALRGAGGEGPVEVEWNLAALAASLPSDRTLRVTVAASDAMHSPSREPGATTVLGGQLLLPAEAGSVSGATPVPGG